MKRVYDIISIRNLRSGEGSIKEYESHKNTNLQLPTTLSCIQILIENNLTKGYITIPIENYFQTFYPRIFTLDMILFLIELQITFLKQFLSQDCFVLIAYQITE